MSAAEPAGEVRSAELAGGSQLVGRAVLSPLGVDSTGAATEFVVDNPRGSDLRVQLRQLRLHGASAEQNKALRQLVYDTYAMGVANVPAFTPLLECVAESATVLEHSDANWQGMRFVFVPIETSAGTQYHASMQGDPQLPDQHYEFTYQGRTTLVTLEQQSKYYRGQDGQWYRTNPLELITHELAHGCSRLQTWTRQGEAAYQASRRAGQVPADEIRAIDFVNRTLLEPRGLPGRDPQSYYAVKPETAMPQPKSELEAAALESLQRGPVPSELADYSRPRRQLQESGALSPQALGAALVSHGLCTAGQAGRVACNMLEVAGRQAGGLDEPGPDVLSESVLPYWVVLLDEGASLSKK